jgi:putative membrane protein
MMWNGLGRLGLFPFIIPLLFWALIIAGVVWIVRYTTDWGDHPRVGRRQPGLDVLEERYARGEINREEYLQKKKDIIG